MKIVGLAQGIVLEVETGGGQNFPFYDAHRVVRVEAIEPDEAMLVIGTATPNGPFSPLVSTSCRSERCKGDSSLCCGFQRSVPK